MPNLYRATMGGGGGTTPSDVAIIRVETTTADWIGNTNVKVHIEDASNDNYVGSFDANGRYYHEVVDLGEHTVWVVDADGKEFPVQMADRIVDVTDYGYVYVIQISSYDFIGWLSSVGETTTYATLDDYLAHAHENEKQIRKLMTMHASVDYLLEWCKGDSRSANKILDNDYCAKWINLRDYALDTLYSSPVVKAIMDSVDKYGYGEWALMPQVPKMTSNTAPYGEASASNAVSGAAYLVFDGGDRTSAWNSGVAGEQWIQYKFPSPICVKRALISKMWAAEGQIEQNHKIQGSNDGILWSEPFYEGFEPLEVGRYENYYVDLDNNDKYLYYRDTITNNNGNPWLYELQFYAWQPKGNVPIMTSNNAPYGEVSASSYVTGYEPNYTPFKAFDGTAENREDSWASATNDSAFVPQWIQYKFNNPINVRRFMVVNRNTLGDVESSQTQNPPKDVRLLASNDGTNWTELVTYTNIKTNKLDKWYVDVPNTEYFIFYRLAIDSINLTHTGKVYYVDIAQLQFYGRELSVSVPKMSSNTEPYGEAIGQTPWGSYKWGSAFADHSTEYGNAGFASAAGTKPWVGYDFKKPIKVNSYYVASTNSECPCDFYLEYSDDGVEWISTEQHVDNSWTEKGTYSFDEDYGAHRYWRMASHNTIANASGIPWGVNMWTNFYGLDYSERDFASENPSKYIYDHGVELEEIYHSIMDTNYALSIIEKKPNEIILKSNDSLTRAHIYLFTKNKIDLSYYDAQRIKLGDTLKSTTEVFGWLTTENSNVVGGRNPLNYCEIISQNMPNSVSLDEKSAKSSYYLAVVVGKEALSQIMDTSISEWWLE